MERSSDPGFARAVADHVQWAAGAVRMSPPCTGFRCSHRACRLKKRARMVPVWLMWEEVERRYRVWMAGKF